MEAFNNNKDIMTQSTSFDPIEELLVLLITQDLMLKDKSNKEMTNE